MESKVEESRGTGLNSQPDHEAEERRAALRPVDESQMVLHNQIGEPYSVKLVYPGFYLSLMPGSNFCWVGFPVSKEKLAKRIQAGHRFFIYVTSPERRVIGLAQALGPVEFLPEYDYKRPYLLELAWIIAPRSPGVRFTDIGLEVRTRVGDSTYAITGEVASALIAKLEPMPLLDRCQLLVLKEKYKMYD